MNIINNSRGQISSIDLLASILIFILVFTTLRGIWLNNLELVTEEATQTEMRAQTQQALEVLLKSPGNPADWENQPLGTLDIIGLSNNPNVLSASKLNAFTSLPYETALEKLKLNKYDFNFELYSGSNNLFSYGANVDNNSRIISLTRSVIYNGGEARVVFKVFKN